MKHSSVPSPHPWHTYILVPAKCNKMNLARLIFAKHVTMNSSTLPKIHRRENVLTEPQDVLLQG